MASKFSRIQYFPKEMHTVLFRFASLWLSVLVHYRDALTHSLFQLELEQSYATQQNVRRLRMYWDVYMYIVVPLQWRHNERDGVSNHRRVHGLLNRLFRSRSKKTSKLRVTGLCEGNSPVTDEFPSQRASNTENVSIRWRHYAMSGVSIAVVINLICIATFSLAKDTYHHLSYCHLRDERHYWIKMRTQQSVLVERTVELQVFEMSWCSCHSLGQQEKTLHMYRIFLSAKAQRNVR